MDKVTPAQGPSNATDPRRPLGAYVHFPFCLVKCPYCDFVAHRRNPASIDHAAYAGAVLAELGARLEAFADRRERSLCTVFFGGGTPSLWDAGQIGRVRSALLSAFEPPSVVETTVECDAVGLDESACKKLISAGANRLSIGVQTFDGDGLWFLGRAHTAQEGRQAIVSAVRAGVPRVCVDLIHGFSGSSAESAARDARHAVELGATHVSAYGLTIEPATVFGKLALHGRLALADESLASESFCAIDEALTSLGLRHYEISNYALPGHESVHNLGYWRGQDYLGLGCGAVGTLGTKRYRNEPNPARYIEATREAAMERVSVEHETLDPPARLRERIMLGLRTSDGLDLGRAGEALGVEPWTAERTRVVTDLVRRGRLERHGDRLVIPPAAWLWSDDTAASLF
jgi:putative oxygen-independent coproporphyrinogen III oxidase